MSRPKEIRRAIENSTGAAWKPSQGNPTRIDLPWPNVNVEQREAVIAAINMGLADLWEISPFRFGENDSQTEAIIDELFPGDALLCCGKSSAIFATQCREEWRGQLSEQQLIVRWRDRAADICDPLLAVADLAGGKWPEMARAALVELCADSDVADENTGIKLLAAIREIFQERGTDRISTKDLLGELIDRDGDEPWAACWQKDFNAENIKGPAAKLARLLKPFGIIPETIRESDGIWIILNTVYQMFRPPKTS